MGVRTLTLSILGALCAPVGVLLFSSPPALAASITEEQVLDVSSSSASFQARVDPEGSRTTYHFEYDTSEYGSEASHGSSVPASEGSVGEGPVPVVVEAHAQGLSPSTLYHFRVVAKTSGGKVVLDGKDETFKTQVAGGEFALPDGRAWELVSPPNKHGASIEPIEEGVVQASEDGDAVSYLAARVAVGADPAGNTQRTQVLSKRGSEGDWSSQDIATPHDTTTGLISELGWEYRFFSRDLSLGLVEPQGDTPLSPLPEGSEKTIYRRNNDECKSVLTDVIPTTCYLAMITKENVQPKVPFGQGIGVSRGVEFVDGTPDLSHVILQSPYALTANARQNIDNPEYKSLYDWTGGQLQLVSVLPNGRPATEPEPGKPEIGSSAVLGEQSVNVRHAISDSGSRIVWGEAGKEGHLYVRHMTSEETIQIDAVQPGASGNGPVKPQFQTANSEVSKVFFTDQQQLTVGSTAAEGNPDLYECEVTEVAGRLACDLTDLTEDTNPGESADVKGTVLGASEDGSYVYFVADGVLSNVANGEEEQAKPGEANLYMLHYSGERKQWEEPTFITTLSAEDINDWIGLAEGNLGFMTARVSPEGRYVAFMSHRSLTGYDNHDVNSGEPDAEVYLYHASPKRLICASCNPTGVRPLGMFDGSRRPLVDRRGSSREQWIAGSVPGWTSVDLSYALYQSRYLSNSGRLFFNSADALVPQDVNGKENVYEYEPEGEGSCQNSSVTFSEKSGGCVGLISSGTSDEESAFLDASASGDDVFFLTASQLVPQDVETSLAVYDAHVCGAEGVACTAAAVSPSPCTTADSCRAAPQMQPAIFGAPVSATFSGSGNLSPPATTKAKPLTSAQKLAKALAGCGKKLRKKRAACERQARKKYAPAHKAKKTNRRSK